MTTLCVIITAIRSQAPGWIDAAVAYSARYLGFMVGPGKKDSSWHKPMDKWLSRISLWARRSVGLALHLSQLTLTPSHASAS